MKFITVMFVSVLAIVTVPTVVGGPSTNIRVIAPLDANEKDALHRCLDSYRTNNWEGMWCGGRGWFKGSRFYDSPEDCYDACNTGISLAINSDASDVRCDDREGGADCWMGYH